MVGMLSDFVEEAANAPGTSLNVVLAGAAVDRVSWRQVYPDGSPVFYFLDDGGQAEWGVGTFHAGTPNFISRDAVVNNTSGNTNRLNFQGSVRIYNEVPGERLPYINNGVISAPGARLDTHAGGVPIGASMDYYGTVVPAGWVWANGQILSRTTYAALFAVLGTTYNAVGTGAGSFNVPNRQEQFSVGRSGMGGAVSPGRITILPNILGLGSWIGDQHLTAHNHVLNFSDPGHAHPLSDPGHMHDVTDPGHNHPYVLPSFPAGSGFAAGATSAVQNTGGATGVSGTGISVRLSGTSISMAAQVTGIQASVASNGQGTQENIPPAIVCNCIIFAGAVP
jgi:microcystin-dependent protein